MTAVSEPHAQSLVEGGRYLEVDPAAVAAAREFTARYLSAVKLDDGHVDDVVLVVSELVTNATKYGGEGNVHLKIAIWPKWTLVAVDDRTRAVYDPPPSPDAVEDLRESGRGLQIVEYLAERFWWDCKAMSKTANAAILRPGMEMTNEDNAILSRLRMAEASDDPPAEPKP